VGFASWQCYCMASSSGRQPNFAALNRGHHLCSAGRPSRWALAHISRCKCAARGWVKIQDAKNRHFDIIAQLCLAVPSRLRHVSTIGKNLLNIDTFPTRSHNMVNFGLLTAEICWRVWSTPANFNGFHVLAALLHGIPVFGVSQTLRR